MNKILSIFFIIVLSIPTVIGISSLFNEKLLFVSDEKNLLDAVRKYYHVDRASLLRNNSKDNPKKKNPFIFSK